MDNSSGKFTHTEVTAYHEAGHAVAALQHRRYVDLISVSLEIPGNGITRYLRSNFINPFLFLDGAGAVSAAWDLELQETKGEIKIL